MTPVNQGISFCAASPNSTGVATEIRALGSASVAAQNLTLQASPVPGSIGGFFASFGQAQVPLGTGFLCITEPLALIGAVAPVGAVAELELSLPSSAVGLAANFQYLFLEGAANLIRTSNGVQVTFQP